MFTAGSDPERPLAREAELAAGGICGGEHRSGSIALTWRGAGLPATRSRRGVIRFNWLAQM